MVTQSYIDRPVSEPIQPGTPSQHACTKQRTEEARNGILKASAHHSDSGEDEPAKADDRAGMNVPDESLSPGEIHRSLGMSNVCSACEGVRACWPELSRP
jgi:hypothetical protein